jgi:hypothetical protein
VTVTRKLHALAVLGIGAALAMTGCSSDKAVKRGQLESGVKAKLEAVAHAKAKSVSCPNKLKAKTDATTRCTLVAMDGSRIGVTVTVTSVKGSHVTYTAQADQHPMR